MGDTIWLHDRTGGRTPMQWEASPTAGFSNADPGSLFAPVIDDEVFGKDRINVASQMGKHDSLRASVRHMIKTRKEHPEFGRGDFALIDLENKHVAAFERTYQDQSILAIHNLSDGPQVVSLKTKKSANSQTDLLTQNTFDLQNTILELAPYQFLWLK